MGKPLVPVGPTLFIHLGHPSATCRTNLSFKLDSIFNYSNICIVCNTFMSLTIVLWKNTKTNFLNQICYLPNLNVTSLHTYDNCYHNAKH